MVETRIKAGASSQQGGGHIPAGSPSPDRDEDPELYGEGTVIAADPEEFPPPAPRGDTTEQQPGQRKEKERAGTGGKRKRSGSGLPKPPADRPPTSEEREAQVERAMQMLDKVLR